MTTRKKEKVDYFSMLPKSYIEEILQDPKFNKSAIKKIELGDFFDLFPNVDLNSASKISIDSLIKKLKEFKEEKIEKVDDIILEHYSYYDDQTLTFYGIKELTIIEKLELIRLDARNWYSKYNRKLNKELKEKELYERLKKKFESNKSLIEKFD